jgi:N-acetyl-gamma-glutamyl-phosphate reductase
LRVQVGVVGASGYTGAELLRLCADHPDFEVAVAGAESQSGKAVASVYPSLAAAYPHLEFAKVVPDDLDGLDVVFLALPHGESQRLVPDLVGRTGAIVDLAADFRLREAASYPTWYGHDHAAPELLARFVCGLPELFRDDLQDAPLVAVPGCYPTAAALALAPLVRSGMVEAEGIVVDAASGVSGAGRAPSPTTHFGAADENFCAYGLLDHRHTPEIEQLVGAEVLFTPHLAPMNRGILATCYARPRSTRSTQDVLDVLHAAYDAEPFVVVSEAPPSTKATLGSNCAHLTARADARTGWVVVLCALDNLGKGASGQAMQCANVVLGLPQTAGLARAGVYP